MFVPSLSWQTIVVWRISKHTFIRNRELTPFVKCICYTIVFCTYARTQKCTRRMISHVPKSKLLADCSTDVHLPWVGSNQCNCSHGLPGSAATGADTDASSLFFFCWGGVPAVLFVPSLSWQSDRDSQENSFNLKMDLGAVSAGLPADSPMANYVGRSPVRKTPLIVRHLHIKTKILPRQARDKHRESTQKRVAFFAGLSALLPLPHTRGVVPSRGQGRG